MKELKKTLVGDEAAVQTRRALVGECRDVGRSVLERLEAIGNEAVARESK